jgi:Mor family transcriptional regulator
MANQATRRTAARAAKVRRLEADLAAARAELDSALFSEHEDGISIVALARATGLSRYTVYNSIDRHRAQLGA